MTRPVKIAVLADTREAVRGFGAAGDAAESAGRGFDKAGAAAKEAEAKFEGVGEGADTVASKGAQAAGAMSGLGSLMGGPFGGAMVVGGTAMQAAADAGDLLNVAIEGGAKAASKAAGFVMSLGKAETYASAAKKVSAGAQWALNAAMSANPIGIVVVAIAALVAGFILAWKKSETFRNIVTGAFEGVKVAAGAVGDAFKAVWESVTKWLGKAWDFISGLPGKIKDAFSGIWSGLADGLKAAINAVLHLPLRIPVIDTHIPGVGKVGGQTLIPALAHGGIVTRPTLALIGEAGPEAVIPLNRRNRAGGDTYVTVHVSVPVSTSPESVGREIAQALKAYVNVGGKVVLA